MLALAAGIVVRAIYPDWATWFTGWFEAVAIAGASAAAILTWRASINLRRGELYQKLFDQFYADDRYKRMRAAVDPSKANEFAKLTAVFELYQRGKVTDGAESVAALEEFGEALTDYLNFFEFVATLEGNKRLGGDDISALFNYYLKNLAHSPALADYIQGDENSFEALDRLLRDRYRV